MAYEVFARKWRPRLFDDVVGQEHVTRTLRNAIRAGRLAHAYLFVGPRGIGKTSLARIFAEALNCEQGPTENPCGVCDSCREIAAGNNLDVLEIDGASNNRVDEIRDLRENVKFLPTRGRFKIYIIDEVHMLSTAAFNALLKTLEEPPPHVKFILATTEPQKILSTILSRCQRFDLRRISVVDIVGRLRKIAAEEAIVASDDALAAMARAAEGSLRDAVSALDQLRAFKGDTIAEDDVLSVFGLVSRQSLQDLARAILDGDVRGIISTVHWLDENGKDMQRLLVELLEHFRNVLVVHYAPDGIDASDLLEGQDEILREQAARGDPERLLRITDLLIEAEPRLRYALSRRTLMETTLIRCARAAVTVSIDQIIERLDALGAGSSDDPPLALTPAQAAPQVPAAALPSVPPPVAVKAVPPPTTVDVSEACDRLSAAWHEIVEAVGQMAPMARGALLDARPLAVTAKQVTIGLDPEFADDLKRLDHPRTHRALQRVLKDRLGCSLAVELRLMTETERAALPRRADLAAAPVAAADVAPPPTVAPTAAKAVSASAAWKNDPLVRDTLDIFKGTIVEVRE